jgi:hypothetical protein
MIEEMKIYCIVCSFGRRKKQIELISAEVIHTLKKCFRELQLLISMSTSNIEI